MFDLGLVRPQVHLERVGVVMLVGGLVRTFFRHQGREDDLVRLQHGTHCRFCFCLRHDFPLTTTWLPCTTLERPPWSTISAWASRLRRHSAALPGSLRPWRGCGPI